MKMIVTKREYNTAREVVINIIKNVPNDMMDMEEKYEAITALQNDENFNSEALKITFNNESNEEYFLMEYNEEDSIESLRFIDSISERLVKLICNIYNMVMMFADWFETSYEIFGEKMKHRFAPIIDKEDAIKEEIIEETSENKEEVIEE